MIKGYKAVVQGEWQHIVMPGELNSWLRNCYSISKLAYGIGMKFVNEFKFEYITS